MRLRALIAMPVAALAAAAPAHAALPAHARLAECERGAATFEADMSAIEGASRLQMRFSLRMRAPGRGWVRVAVPGWNEWAAAAPGRRRYVFTRRVENLVAPAAYRVVVRFRWRDAAGEVLATTRRTARACRQGDPRPNLVPLRIRALPGVAEGRHAYEVVVRNAGDGGAAPFAVGLTVAGARLDDLQAPPLAPGERATVTFDGPACAPGERIAAMVDVSGAVDDSDESDDRLAVPCPAA